MHKYKSLKNKNILITGGLGFIGSNLAIRLIDLGAHVMVVDSMLPEFGGNLFNIEPIKNRIKINISDVRDEFSMKYLVKDMDYLFNLAGQNSHMDSMENPYTDLDINVKAQLSILEACRKYNRKIKILFSSTRQIYGAPEYLPVDEKHPLKPVDVNGINKLAGENFHLLYHTVYGIRTVVFRLTNTIGPRMRIKDARQTFLGLWIKLVLENKKFEVWEGDQIRDFSDVEDVIEAFLLAAVSEKSDGKIFNLGGPELISLKNLADILIELNGQGSYGIKKFPSDRKKIDIGNYYSDFSLIKNLMGWEPRISLKKSLSTILEYYRINLKEYL